MDLLIGYGKGGLEVSPRSEEAARETNQLSTDCLDLDALLANALSSSVHR